MRIKFFKSFFAVLILLLLVGCPTNPIPGTFTANMTTGVRYLQTTGKIFVKGNKYRMDLMDLKEGKEEISILVNRENGKNIFLVHSKKIAQEYLNTSPKSQSNNLFEDFNFLLKKNSSRKKGSEVLEGYECGKIEVYKKDKIFATALVSNKLNWPIKIEKNDNPKKYVILHNIKEEPVEESLFQIPEDYKFYPISEDKKEKAPDKKITPPKLEKLGPKKKAVVDKLEENGIQFKTREGTLFIRAFGASVLTRSFPGWYFYLIDRVKEGATTFGNKSKMKAAVSKDDKNVYILYSPEKDKPLDNGLKMVQYQNIKLNDEKDVRKLGDALFFLYFRGEKIGNVESLGENEWAIYKQSNSEYLEGLTLKTNANGEVTELNYKTKIKKR